MPRLAQRAAFTLIELLMVVLIIGVLASVAIPTYTGAKDSARDRQAFDALEVALRHGAAAFTLEEAFPAAGELANRIASSEPGLGAVASTGWPLNGVAVSSSATVAEYHASSRSGGRVAVRDDRAFNQVSRWRSTKQDVAGGPVVNELVNPSFETGALSGWSVVCGSSSTCTANNPAHADPAGPGRHAMSRTVTGDDDTGTRYTALRSNRVPVSAGDVVYVRAQMKLLAGECRLQAAVHPYRADNTSPGVYYPPGQAVDDAPIGQWVTLRGTYTVPADITEVQLRATCHHTPVGTSATLLTDRAMLVVNPPAANPAPGYIDGDAPGGQWLAGGAAAGKSEGVPIDWQ